MSETTNRWIGRAAQVSLRPAPILMLMLVAVGSLSLVSVSAPRPAVAHDDEIGHLTGCPALTDSIRRVYLVVLGREPEAAELTQASARYGSGEADLEQLAEEMLNSAEYAQWYGELDDDAFVVEAHRTALGKAPDIDDRQRWLELLSGDVSRARLILLLAESETVVASTNTHEPLAGHLQTYPPGTHWYCGIGIVNELPIRPLTGSTYFADVLFTNRGSSQDSIAVRTTLNGVPNVVIQQGSLPPSFSSYTWGGAFSGADNYGNHLDVRAGPDTSWAVVFYPFAISDSRSGWQITP